jgi:hypothetical protein
MLCAVQIVCFQSNHQSKAFAKPATLGDGMQGLVRASIPV